MSDKQMNYPFKHVIAVIILIAMSNFKVTGQDLVLSGLKHPDGIASDSVAIYVPHEGEQNDTSYILKFSKVSMDFVRDTLHTETVHQGITDLKLNENYLYVCYITGAISRLDLSDSAPKPEDIANGLSGPTHVVFSGKYMYIAEYIGNSISRMDLSDPNKKPITLLNGLNRPDGLVIIGDWLYFTQASANKISKIDLTKNNFTSQDVVSGLEFPIDLLHINNNLLIVENKGNKVSSINLTDTTLQPIVRNLSSPSRMALYKDLLCITNIENEEVVCHKLSGLINLDDKLHYSLNKVFPNPVINEVNVVLNSPQSCMINIYNLSGTLLQSKNHTKSDGINIQCRIDHGPGIYFLRIISTSETSTFKIIKL